MGCGSVTVPASIEGFELRRMIAAYKLRLATKAAALGGRPETWGRGETISAEVEKRQLTEHDKYRIAPYPYPGLRSFDREEGELFFARERNVEALRAILAERRLVVVLGGSGSGKSSLIRAGLLPVLNTERRISGRNGNWYGVEFRPRTDPLGELAVALVDQLQRPLLKLRCNGLPEALGLDRDADGDARSTIDYLHDQMRQRFMAAKKAGRQQVLDALLDVADHQLELYDRLATQGRRLAEPNLFLLLDQLEEVFRPEVAADERDALLNLIVDLHDHMRRQSQRGGLFLAVTIRSEEVHRCAEHRGLSEVVIGSGYQLELLDPDNPEDASDLRRAIVQPARNVLEDWGLTEHLSHPDAPFAEGMPDLLLQGAARLSAELEHRPDQLPLLQHALQAIWHSAIRRWSDPTFKPDRLEITPRDLPGYPGSGVPDLGECLKQRADKAAERAAERFAEIAGTTDVAEGKALEAGWQALQATFRALARRDDKGNWARRFADRDDITAFLKADPDSAVAGLPDEKRWSALREALHVFLLRGYLSGGDGREYDISHEALIRNWPRFQEWLRGPEEVAYALGRVLMEVEPKAFEKAPADQKMRLIPEELAKRVATVATGGALPGRWGEDQIAPYLLRPALRKLWGDEKHEALQQVARLADLADQARAQAAATMKAAERHDAAEKARREEREAAEKTRRQELEAAQKARRRARTIVALVSVGALVVFALTVFFGRYEAASSRARAVAASNLIGSMQSEDWIEGAPERAALQVLDMLAGGGRDLPLEFLRPLTLARWDAGVRRILGQRFQVTGIDQLPAGDGQPSCLTVDERAAPADPVRNPQSSVAVPLRGAARTEVRAAMPTSQSRLRLETKDNGNDWREAALDIGMHLPRGTRLCLAPDGSVLVVSHRGTALPALYELHWQPSGASWRVGWRQIRPLASLAATDRVAFTCVRSIRISHGPADDRGPTFVRVAFTAEELQATCVSGAQSPGNKPLQEASYVSGVAAAVLRAAPEKGLPFKRCEDRDKDGNRWCDVGLATGGIKQMLALRRKPLPWPDYWSIWIHPVIGPEYAINDVLLLAPPMTEAAVDPDHNIWLTDGNGLFWKLVNDRAVLTGALWERASALVNNSYWPRNVSPELSENMSKTELEKRPPRR